MLSYLGTHAVQPVLMSTLVMGQWRGRGSGAAMQRGWCLHLISKYVGRAISGSSGRGSAYGEIDINFATVIVSLTNI